MLWNIFNTLQLLLALKFMLDINLPVNVLELQEELYDLVNFQIIDKKVLYGEIMGDAFSYSEGTEEEAEGGEATE